MDGKPLAREHGAPARVVIPEMYGYKNVKWVSRIVVGTASGPGYWEQRGYDVDAWVGRSNGY
jgi:DMSO/TMAO reductase YedYZ molybdopterin-dependent catalytic subunit